MKKKYLCKYYFLDDYAKIYYQETRLAYDKAHARDLLRDLYRDIKITSVKEVVE